MLNRHGLVAQEYWETYRPTALAELENPEEFFQGLGMRVAARIGEVAEQMLAELPIEEQATQRQAVRGQVQEMVYDQEIYLPKEPGTEHREM
jgi:hypothetical protein